MLPFLTQPHDTVNSDSKWEIREHPSITSPLTCLVSVVVPRTFKIYFNKKVVPSFTIYVINTASTSSYPDPLCQFLFYSVYTLVISLLCLFLWLPSWNEVRNVLVWMHTSAQRLTGADSMKREAAEINTYVMRQKEHPNGLPIYVCQRLSVDRIDV